MYTRRDLLEDEALKFLDGIAIPPFSKKRQVGCLKSEVPVLTFGQRNDFGFINCKEASVTTEDQTYRSSYCLEPSLLLQCSEASLNLSEKGAADCREDLRELKKHQEPSNVDENSTKSIEDPKFSACSTHSSNTSLKEVYLPAITGSQDTVGIVNSLIWMKNHPIGKIIRLDEKENIIEEPTTNRLEKSQLIFEKLDLQGIKTIAENKCTLTKYLPGKQNTPLIHFFKKPSDEVEYKTHNLSYHSLQTKMNENVQVYQHVALSPGAGFIKEMHYSKDESRLPKPYEWMKEIKNNKLVMKQDIIEKDFTDVPKGKVHQNVNERIPQGKMISQIRKIGSTEFTNENFRGTIKYEQPNGKQVRSSQEMSVGGLEETNGSENIKKIPSITDESYNMLIRPNKFKQLPGLLKGSLNDPQVSKLIIKSEIIGDRSNDDLIEEDKIVSKFQNANIKRKESTFSGELNFAEFKQQKKTGGDLEKCFVINESIPTNFKDFKYLKSLFDKKKFNKIGHLSEKHNLVSKEQDSIPLKISDENITEIQDEELESKSIQNSNKIVEDYLNSNRKDNMRYSETLAHEISILLNPLTKKYSQSGKTVEDMELKENSLVNIDDNLEKSTQSTVQNKNEHPETMKTDQFRQKKLKCKHGKVLCENGRLAFLYDEKGYPLTDLKGRILRNNKRSSLLDLENLPGHGKVFDSANVNMESPDFDPSQRPKLNTIVKITDHGRHPAELFTNNGLPLTDEDGLLLHGSNGNILVTMDSKFFPLCCKNGLPIYLRNGASWLSHRSKYIVTTQHKANGKVNVGTSTVNLDLHKQEKSFMPYIKEFEKGTMIHDSSDGNVATGGQAIEKKKVKPSKLAELLQEMIYAKLISGTKKSKEVKLKKTRSSVPLAQPVRKPAIAVDRSYPAYLSESFHNIRRLGVPRPNPYNNQAFREALCLLSGNRLYQRRAMLPSYIDNGAALLDLFEQNLPPEYSPTPVNPYTQRQIYDKKNKLVADKSYPFYPADNYQGPEPVLRRSVQNYLAVPEIPQNPVDFYAGHIHQGESMPEMMGLPEVPENASSYTRQDYRDQYPSHYTPIFHNSMYYY